MLDHEQIEAPQFHEEVGTGQKPEGLHVPTGHEPDGQTPLPMQAAGAALYLGTMMFMPLRIAMALPQVAVAESRTSPILRHLDWQRSRERARQ